MTDLPLVPPDEANAGAPPVPGAINLPDHGVRQALWYQIYVRLARPTLDWATIAWFTWVTMLEPLVKDRFDAIAAPMCLLWCGTVYGIRTYEKTKGVA